MNAWRLVQAIIQKFSFFFIFAFCLKRAKHIVASASGKAVDATKVALSTPVSLTVGYVADGGDPAVKLAP